MGSANGTSNMPVPLMYPYYGVYKSIYFRITLHFEKYMSPATNIPLRMSILISPPASPQLRRRSARHCRRSLNRRLILHLPRREELGVREGLGVREELGAREGLGAREELGGGEATGGISRWGGRDGERRGGNRGGGDRKGIACCR